MLKNLLARTLPPETAEKMNEFIDFAVPSCEKSYKSTDPAYHFWSTYLPSDLPTHGRNGLKKRLKRELKLIGVPVKEIEFGVGGDFEDEYWEVIEVWFAR